MPPRLAVHEHQSRQVRCRVAPLQRIWRSAKRSNARHPGHDLGPYRSHACKRLHRYRAVFHRGRHVGGGSKSKIRSVLLGQHEHRPGCDTASAHADPLEPDLAWRRTVDVAAIERFQHDLGDPGRASRGCANRNGAVETVYVLREWSKVVAKGWIAMVRWQIGGGPAAMRGQIVATFCAMGRAEEEPAGLDPADARVVARRRRFCSGTSRMVRHDPEAHDH